MSTNPLRSTLEHIEELESEVDHAILDLNQIPYPKVRHNLEVAGHNYRAGLVAIKNILNKLVERATAVEELSALTGRKLTLHEALRKYWGKEVNQSYLTAERFTTNFRLESQGGIPWELYYMVLDIFDGFGFDETFVFREGSHFMNETSEETISEVLDPLAKALQEPIPGKIDGQATREEIIPPISSAHAISYIAGEARNAVLWPVLVHEAFHLLDKRLGLFGKMEKSLAGTQRLPILDKTKDAEVNRRWSREIFQDIMAIHYFGPLYSHSLMRYFERLPYIQTIEHPEMSSRLYAVSKYLEDIRDAPISGSDIVVKALRFCGPGLEAEMVKYRDSGELTKETRLELDMFYRSVTSWLKLQKTTLFGDRLRQYVEESEKAPQMAQLNNVDQVPFVDPLLNFDEVVDLVFRSGVYPPLHPTLLLNIILSVSDQFSPPGFYDRFVECMKKWCVKRAWNQAMAASKNQEDK